MKEFSLGGVENERFFLFAGWADAAFEVEIVRDSGSCSPGGKPVN